MSQVRKIIDYSKLTPELLQLLTDKFPNGYSNSDIVKFKNASNELIEAVRIETEEVIYLVKVGKRLVEKMEAYADDDNDDADDDVMSDDEVDVGDVDENGDEDDD